MGAAEGAADSAAPRRGEGGYYAWLALEKAQRADCHSPSTARHAASSAASSTAKRAAKRAASNTAKRAASSAAREVTGGHQHHGLQRERSHARRDPHGAGPVLQHDRLSAELGGAHPPRPLAGARSGPHP